MAGKYYQIIPYAYMGNNPIKYVDLKGDCISMSSIMAYDKSMEQNICKI